ncbi:hypothetical protein HAHE_30950 [Haloferula helveola]|uniref:DUF4129 domain-containing protein n=1 Tax=Haloferula helveola TaxID=490095 RepID=A0ABN6H8F1_9BACT|nr:hypothetical protein HAHE_30950 [Haloferula helveola]
MSQRIVCKPTPWFLLRAAAMILMFGIFAAMFFKDGRSGYREENLSYYVWKAVERAVAEFGERKDEMSPSEWRRFAEIQEVEFPENRNLLPEGTVESVKWPELLSDYDAMSAGLGNPERDLFDPIRDQLNLVKEAPEHAHTEREIFEQWVVFWICLVLFLGALFLLLRTMARKIVLDGTTLQPAGGKPVELGDLVRLDLRRWKSKGLAFAWSDNGSGGERKIRIDGLTYGGFKHDDGEPAEKLIQAVRAGFSGELIDYEGESSEPPPEKPSDV